MYLKKWRLPIYIKCNYLLFNTDFIISVMYFIKMEIAKDIGTEKITTKKYKKTMTKQQQKQIPEAVASYII